MSLLELAIDNVRCIEHAQLSLHPGLNLIWGSNGSGKTSLLEAIFLLGRGRSFRTRNSERLIRHGVDQLVVFGRIGAARGVDGVRLGAEPDEPPTLNGTSGSSESALHPSDGPWTKTLGVQVSRREGTVARISGATAGSLTELTEAFSVQVIDPGIHKLLEEGSNRRRRWMDWGVFHVERRFADWWVRYTRALKQRNAALKSSGQAGAQAWEPELARLGELISEARQRFVESFLPYWRDAVIALSDLEPELHYFRGWGQDATLAESLVAARDRDEARRLTHPGPHRADLMIRVHGRLAREVMSRGQQKLVAVAMTLAQLHLVQETTGAVPSLLLDDPAAELDGEHLARFITHVKRLRSQLIVTSLRREFDLFGAPDRVFHVEQGRVQPDRRSAV